MAQHSFRHGCVRLQGFVWRKQDILKNEEAPERDILEQNMPEGKMGR
jgi:hypothetical protein